MCVRERDRVYLCQEIVYGRDRRKKGRSGWEYIPTPSRANEKFLQRKVGYCNIFFMTELIREGLWLDLWVMTQDLAMSP